METGEPQKQGPASLADAVEKWDPVSNASSDIILWRPHMCNGTCTMSCAVLYLLEHTYAKFKGLVWWLSEPSCYAYLVTRVRVPRTTRIKVEELTSQNSPHFHIHAVVHMPIYHERVCVWTHAHTYKSDFTKKKFKVILSHIVTLRSSGQHETLSLKIANIPSKKQNKNLTKEQRYNIVSANMSLNVA